MWAQGTQRAVDARHRKACSSHRHVTCGEQLTHLFKRLLEPGKVHVTLLCHSQSHKASAERGSPTPHEDCS